MRGGSVEIVWLARLGGSATLELTRQARQEINFFENRVRVQYDPGVAGLDPIPIGVYLFSSPEETNSITTQERTGLLTKMVVIDEDSLTETLSLDAGTPVVDAVVSIIQSTGEYRIAVTDSDAVLSNPLVWKAGESKLTVINTLLEAIGYRSLWCDGLGQYRVEPYDYSGEKAIAWTFRAGDTAIHKPDWTRSQDLTGIPNRVIVVSPGTDEEPAIVGIAENNDPESPFSIPRRGVRTRREEVSDIESQTVANELAERYLFNSMNPVARLSVTHAIVPLEPGQRVRFISGGITRDASILRMSMDFNYASQCKAEWRELT